MRSHSTVRAKRFPVAAVVLVAVALYVALPASAIGRASPAPAVQLDRTSVRSGGSVTATGSGWTPNSLVHVAACSPYPRTQCTLTGDVATVTSDGSGNFTKRLYVDPSIFMIGPASFFFDIAGEDIDAVFVVTAPSPTTSSTTATTILRPTTTPSTTTTTTPVPSTTTSSSTTTSTIPSPKYVALGDSYASGEGVPVDGHFESGTDPTLGGNSCHRSAKAYGPLISADNPSLGSFTFKACSGATVEDIVYGGQSNGVQIDSLDTQTILVTVSMGGDDIGFAPALIACRAVSAGYSTVDFLFGACPLFFRSVGDRGMDAVTQNIDHLFYASNDPKHPNDVGLVGALNKIHVRFALAKVYLVGYPDPFADPTPALDQVCTAASYPALPEDTRWLRDKAAYLNKMERSAARAAGVHFLDPTDATDEDGNALPNAARDRFNGHELCSRQPWFNDVQVLDGVHPSDFHYWYHPNGAGQDAFRRLLEDGRIGNLPDNPRPDPTVTWQPNPGRSVPLDFGTSDLVVKAGETINGVRLRVGDIIRLIGDGFAPQDVVVKVYSDPVPVGTFRPDSSGHVSADITIPAAVGPGQHVIVAQGTSASGSKRVLLLPFTVAGAGAAVPTLSPPRARRGGDSSWVPLTIVGLVLLAGLIVVLVVRRTRGTKATRGQRLRAGP